MPDALDAIVDRETKSAGDPLDQVIERETQPRGNPYIEGNSAGIPKPPTGQKSSVLDRISKAGPHQPMSHPDSEGQPLSKGFHQAAQTAHMPPAYWGIGEVPEHGAGYEAWRAISTGFVNALPRGMPFVGGAIKEAQATNAISEPVEGTVNKGLEMVSGMVGGLANPENLPAMVAGGYAGKAVGEVAHPVVKWVSATAGDRVGQALNSFINNASQGAALSATQAAEEIPPEQWVADPFGSLGRVAVRATIGGAAFGGIGAAHGAIQGGPVPEPSKGSQRPQYPGETQFKQDVQASYGSMAPAPTEGRPVEPIGPVLPEGPSGPPDAPYTPQRGVRGEQPQPEIINDQEVQGRVQGGQQEGQEPGGAVQEQVPGTEEAGAGGVLQAQGEVAAEPKPAEAKAAALDVEKVAKQHRRDIIAQMPEMAVDDALAVDQQLHRDAVAQGRFAKDHPALEADIEAKQMVRDLISGKTEVTQENIDRAKGILVKGRTTHVGLMGKRGNANVGGKDWHRAMVQMYDRAIAAVDELVMPPPPLMSGDAATAKALSRPDNPDVKVGGKWLKRGHKLTKAGESFLAQHQSPSQASSPQEASVHGQSAPSASAPALEQSRSAPSPERSAGQPKPASNGSKSISFRYDPTTKTTVVETPKVEPTSPEKMRELMQKKPKPGPDPQPKEVAAPQPAAKPSTPSGTQAPAAASSPAKSEAQVPAKAASGSPKADVEKAGPSKPPARAVAGSRPSPAETAAKPSPSTQAEAAAPSGQGRRQHAPQSEASRGRTPEEKPASSPPDQHTTAPAEQPAGATSARKAWQDIDREDLGLDTLPEAKSKSWQKSLDEADPADALSLAASVNKKARALNDRETASIVVRAAGLKKAHKAESDPVELARIEEEFDALSRALRTSGTELGRGLAAHKLTIDEDFGLLNVQQRVKTAKQGDLTPEERTQIAALVKKVEEAEAKVKAMQAKLPPDTPFPPPPMLKLLGEADRMKYNVRSYIAGKRKVGTLRRIADVLGIFKTVKTSWDISAPGRQGFLLGLVHPKRAGSAFAAQIKALGSEQAAATVMASIKADTVRYELSKKAGLELTEYGKGSGVVTREETFQTSLADSKVAKYTGVAASNRAYATYLNKLRFDIFNDMIDTLAKGGEPTLKEAKAIANYINLTTGRGHLHGSLAGASQLLNAIFFSPRYLTSRIELLVGQPIWAGSARTRVMIGKEYGKIVAGLGLALGLAANSGATVETDPRSSDFLKLKIGDTRVDIMTGISQLFTLGGKMSGKEKSAATGELSYPGDLNRWEAIGRFARSKLAPIPSTLVNVLSEKDVQGRKPTISTEAQNLMAPMAATDIWQSVEANGVPKGAALGMASLIGFSVQTHRAVSEEQKSKTGYVQAMKHLDNLMSQANRLPAPQRLPWVLQQVNKDMGGTKWYGPVIEQVMRRKASIASP